MRYLRLFIFAVSLLLPIGKLWAGELVWTGKNNARWSDLSSWKTSLSNNSLTGLPGRQDKVIIPASTNARIILDGDISIHDLVVEKGARVEFYTLSEIHWNIEGTADFGQKTRFAGIQHFYFNTRGAGAFLRSSGTQFSGNLVFKGRNEIRVTDDIQTQKDLVLDGQKIIFNGEFIAANAFRLTAGTRNNSVLNGAKLILNEKTIANDQLLKDDSYEVLNGNRQGIGGGGVLNPCGTIPFLLTAVATSNYNGYDVSCNGASDGTICVNVTGGVGPFNYSWVGGPATACYSGVDAGSYIVVVFDMGQGGVSCFTTIVVDEPTEMTLLSWTGNDPSCFGACDGTAAPVIVGGVSPYSYLWSTGETTPVATQLCNGINTVQVTDANGCIFDTTFFILIPTQVDPGLVATPTSCFGVCDGAVASNPSGGNGAPYTYNWSTGSTADSIGGLCAGTYFIEVTDQDGCTGTDTINVTQPVSIAVSVTSIVDLVCNGNCSGSISVNVSNGTPPYTLQWFNATTGLPVPGATGTTVSGLCAGTYYVVVNDNGSCTFQSTDITITQPPPINVSVSATNIDCNGACNGVLTATTLSGGTGPLSVTWFNAATGTSVGTGNPLGGRCAGSYFAQVTDGNGCIELSSVVTITEPPALNISVSQTNILCSGACTGTATATVSGGTGVLSVTWHESPSGILIGSGTTINALCAGDYFATVTDANGCTLNSSVFSVIEPFPLSIISQGNTDISCNGSCNGMAFFSISGGSPPVTITWYEDPGAVPTGQTGDTAVGLCAGTYFAEAVDANGCSLQSANQVITQPLPVNITVTATSSQCGTTCDGSASAAISGGTPGYTFTWVDSTSGAVLPDTVSSVSGLCAGTYYVVVTDASNCQDTSAFFEIEATVNVNGSVTGIDATCNGFCNGIGDLVPAGGIPPYTFEWFNQATGLPIGQSTEDANGLCAGDYYVIVTDSTNCNSIPLNVTINEPTPVDIILTPQNVTCFGACNGQITAVVSGGTPGYTFNWFNAVTGLPIGQTGATATGICAGSYFLQVTDANGCLTNSATVTLTQPTQITFSISTTPVSCFGVCDGTASLVISGGTGPYTVNWSTSANTTATETGICAGNHSFSITDASGCTRGPFNFTITSPANVTATPVNGTVACNGGCTGIVSVNVSGGTSPYTYLWDDPAAQTTPVAGGLCDGSYNVMVTDAAGCNYGPFNATVTDPNTLSASVTTSTNTSCAAGCSGTATVTITGGTAPYTVSWNDPLAQTTLTAMQLCAGNYTVTVTDANGCSTTANVTINTTSGPSVSISSTNTQCSGSCNGTASATISGGTAPVGILWSNGSTSPNITSLCAGVYTATVTDALGCTDVASVTITETVTPITATVSSTLTACGVCNGNATVTPSGGSGTYNYQWDAAAGSQTTQTAVSLCAGIYTVQVTDVVSGCTGDFTVAVSNAGAETINVDSTAATCAGACTGTATVSFTCGDAPCTVLWNDPSAQTTNTATGLCAGTYGVTVTNASGCISSATIEVTEPEPVQANAIGTNALCNGTCTGQAVAAPTGGNGIYTYSWNDPAGQTAFTAFNLCPGTFIVTVTDSLGCSGQDTVSISEPSPISFVTSSNDVSCSGQCNGTATAFPSGGISPYTFTWDDPGAQTTQLATGLCAGTYNVTVLDSNGCTMGPQSVTVNEPAAPVITISSTNPACGAQCNGTATANVSGGTAPYSFLWTDPAAQTTATATNLCPGTYDVTVTDANGCVLGTASIIITAVPDLTVNVSPSSVTCNGLCDGQLTATISGGTAPYSAIWDDPASQTTAIATALCPASYTVTITDANGCTASVTQSVSEPTALTNTLSVTDATCNGSCTGGATVIPSGGTGAISILWSPGGQTTSSVSGLCAGNYLVSITDTAGCNLQTSFQVNEPPVFTFLTGTSPSQCGVCDGSASISPIGGTPPYTYQWDAAAANQTTQVALNLCAGIYAATVTDQNGCALSANIPVSNTGGEDLAVSTVDATCPDACNGSATASTPCVNGPCSFDWFSVSTGASLGVTTSNISGLCPGDYIATVINSVNCTTMVQFTVGSPDSIEVTETITPPLCNTSCTGAITVSATGGTGSLTFQWDAAAGGGTGNSVSGLCTGSYGLVVTDAAGCDDTLAYTITAPLPITVNVNNTSTFCSGSCTGSATAIVAGGTPGYTYLWDDPAAQTGSTASGLCDGNYTVTVTDANGCTATSGSVAINQPAVLSASTSSTPTVCSGDCDGTGTVTISGGTTPFNIQWDDPLNQTGTTASGLCAGTYNVTVTDANNCSDAGAVTITSPAPVSATFSVTDATCNGSCTGAITVNATGGNGSYIYSIDNGATFQASSTFINLCAGSYQVIIQDTSGCISAVIPVNVNEPTVLGANTSSLNADCGTNNGAASVFPFGGTPGYTINWFDVTLNPLGQTTNTAINLGAGIYTAFIEDNNGCQFQISVTVSNNDAPTTSAVTTLPGCNGDCNGSIDVTVTSGVSPFIYEWSPGGQTTEDLTNVCAGTYILQVTDAPGCISFNTFTLNEPAVFTTNVSTTDATCGQCNGSAVATVTGGTGALSIVWSNLQTGSTATNLCAGAYSVLVTDANGCDEQFNVTVSNTTGPAPVLNVTSPTCFNSCTGAITVSAAGGTAPYSFLWIETGSTADSIGNLCPGTYTVEVMDSAGCVAFSSVNLTSPPALTDSITVVPATCGACDGAVSAFVSGQAPFTFQWGLTAGGATTSSVSALCSGLYDVIITDGNGCSDTAVAMLPNVNAPVVTATPTGVTCFGNCDGSAIAAGTGGNPPLVFNWFDDNMTGILAGAASIDSLCPGNYFVQVTDAFGCSSFNSFEIEEPDSLVASFNFTQDETCFNACDGIISVMPVNGTLPFTYNWTNPAGVTTPVAAGLCDGVYTVNVTDANGCALTLTDTVTQPVPILLALDSTDASCSTIADGAVDATVSGGGGGFIFSWTGPSGFTAATEDISGIFSGTYILTVTDINGCSVSDTIVVNAILIAEADAGPDTVLCASLSGVSLVGTGTPGASYTWTDTSGNVLSTTTILGVSSTTAGGTYIFTVNNAGCIDADTVNISVNPLPIADAGPDQDVITGQAVTIGGNPTTGPGNNITWQPDNNTLSSTAAANPTASPLVTTEYVVQVIDANGCVAYDTVVVEVLPDIIFPNGFSPNGDGANDTWILDFIEFFPDIEVSVYNRWGQPVFYSKGYDTPWDGTYENKPVTVGTYYYVILLNHPLYPDAFTGPLTILR